MNSNTEPLEVLQQKLLLCINPGTYLTSQLQTDVFRKKMVCIQTYFLDHGNDLYPTSCLLDCMYRKSEFLLSIKQTRENDNSHTVFLTPALWAP